MEGIVALDPGKKLTVSTKAVLLADLKAIRLVLDPRKDLDQMVDLYNSTLMDLLEKYAPLRKKQMPQRALQRDTSCKRHRRYCERLWIRTDLSVHYEMFKLARLYVRDPVPLPSLSTVTIRSRNAKVIGKLFLPLLTRYCTEIKQLSHQILTVPK